MEDRFTQITSRVRQAFSGMSGRDFDALVEEAVDHARHTKNARRAPR